MQGLGAMTYPQELGQIYGPVFKARTFPCPLCAYAEYIEAL